MYLQEVVISPDIFEKIGRAFSIDHDEDIDLKSYKDNLELKKILFDKDVNGNSILFDKIKEIIEHTSDFGKLKIGSILKIFEKPERMKFKNIDSSNFYYKDLVDNQVLNLSLLSESKIINSEKSHLYPLRLKFKELQDVEILNFEEFIKPTSNSKVFCFEKLITIKRGKKLLFEDYLKPYLCECKKITIIDKYIRKREGGFMNLLRLLKICKNIEELNIKTILGDNMERYRPDISIEDAKNEITKLKNTLKVNFFTTGDHQRMLKTEMFLITIDPGFDFVNKDYIAERHNVEIKIKIK